MLQHKTHEEPLSTQQQKRLKQSKKEPKTEKSAHTLNKLQTDTLHEKIYKIINKSITINKITDNIPMAIH